MTVDDLRKALEGVDGSLRVFAVGGLDGECMEARTATCDEGAITTHGNWGDEFHANLPPHVMRGATVVFVIE